MKSEKLLERVTFNPEIFGGNPIVRGMRISVESVLSLLAQGVPEREILDDVTLDKGFGKLVYAKHGAHAGLL